MERRTQVMRPEMEVVSLDSIGNFCASSSVLPVRIIPIGHTLHPREIYKDYLIEGERGTEDYVSDSMYLSAREFMEKRIPLEVAELSGIGFSILSNGILNVCRWTKVGRSDVVAPAVFEYDLQGKRAGGAWMPADVRDAGAFCSREKVIYDFENELWLKYLDVVRTEMGRNKINTAKLTYLSNFLRVD